MMCVHNSRFLASSLRSTFLFSVVDADSRTRNEPAAILSWCYFWYVCQMDSRMSSPDGSCILINFSGAISVFFTYPLELLRVRMAFDTIHSSASGKPVRPSCLRTARLIYAEGSPRLSLPSAAPIPRDLFHTFPLLKFYRGFTVSLAGIVPYAGTAFLTWGYLRATLFPVAPDGGRPRATPLADLGIGALSGALAQTVSYPFEVVRRRMQVGGLTQPGRWLRWEETVRAIWMRGGARGFFVGLGIGYLKIVPMNAVSFAVWQGMKRVLGL
jgi:solute carrier family 25 (mitochondrial carrier protein), member 16